MRAGVITVPDRADVLKRLLDVVEPEVSSVQVFMDTERRGPVWNERRMFKAMLPTASVDEPILLMTDDAISLKGWRKMWEAMHERANSNAYSLFSRQHHLFTTANLRRGYITKVQHKGLYNVACVWINQQTLPDRIDRWLDSGGTEWMNAKKKNSASHYDLIVQEYFVFHNLSWTIATPTLFDHQDVPSTLGHPSIKGSPAYIGHPNLGRAPVNLKGLRLAEWRRGELNANKN